MNKFTRLTSSQQGYKVKDGRLMNLAPDGKTGIAQAANMRRSIRNAKKINQIAEGISQQPTPLRAFVVSSEVTTAQSLDRNIEENASF